MNKSGKRITALLLCLLLLPGAALGQGALKYHLTFQMDPEAFPAAQQKQAKGIAAFLNLLELQGSALWRPEKDGTFKISANATLNKDERTKNKFIFWGHEKHWGIRGSLLGEERVMINLLALTEFSLKTYFQLEIPLQRLALALPFTTKLGLQKTLETLQSAFAGEEDRAFNREECLSALSAVTEAAGQDSYFRLWTMAVGLESGYDEILQEWMRQLPQWGDSILDEEGLRITSEDGVETWTSGDQVLLIRDETGLQVSLPQGSAPFGLKLMWVDRTEEGLRSLSGDLTLSDGEEILYQGSLRGDKLPTAWNTDSDFSLTLDSTGPVTPEETHLQLYGSLQKKALTVTWPDNDTGRARLTVTGKLTKYEPSKWPRYTNKSDYGFNLLSVNDSTLPAFLLSIRRPLMQGMLPILLQTPAISISTALDWMEETGILSLLTVQEGEGRESFELSDMMEPMEEAEYDGEYESEYDGEYDSEYDGEYDLEYEGLYEKEPYEAE